MSICQIDFLRVAASSNPTPHADAREAPRLGQSTQPRAGGRERWAAKERTS